MLPPVYTCVFCQTEVDPNAKDVFRRISGWTDGKHGSANYAVTLATDMLQYAHGLCVRDAKNTTKGVEQATLF